MDFSNAVVNQEARTENGMKALASSGASVVDLFYKAGSFRGRDIVPYFVSAYVENRELALRLALWLRDVTEGAGERQLFKDILNYLSATNEDDAKILLSKVPVLGRWDDGFSVENEKLFKFFIEEHVKPALASGNALCAKWCKRKGVIANKTRFYLGMTPKEYRKLIVNLSDTVETKMCAKDWDNINFSHVPSVASARYKKAFYRNAQERYSAYVDALVKGTDPTVKVNASSIFPYDVIKDFLRNVGYNKFSKTEQDFIIKQWDALPNFVGNSSILPMIDVSGSMGSSAGSTGLTCMDVAVSIGLYLADKNLGEFKDVFLTFSSTPNIVKVKGNILEKIVQTVKAHWGMSTNLHAAFNKVLDVAVKGNVSQEEMPKYILILSDMQFNSCVRYDDSAIEMIRRKYEKAGYNMPNVVFWNIGSYDNVPVKCNEYGVALVSGFSPSITKSILRCDEGEFTPEGVMMSTLMNSRYDLN